MQTSKRAKLDTVPAGGAACCAALALLLGGCTRASSAAGRVAPTSALTQAEVTRFVAALDSLRTAARIPGLSVAVVHDGRVVVARGFGYADVERRIPATAETPYNIASVTKPLAAVVALRLVERGQLDLDRPMTAYDGFTDFCAEARSGGPPLFFRDYACDAGSGANGSPPLTLRHVMSMTANGVPGTRFFYNPVSYSWASRPMMQVTGRSFSDLVAEYVFGPAGMTRSARIHRALPAPALLAAALAKPYHVDSAGAVVRSPDPPPQGDGAAGGVLSTVTDLARFDIALDAGRLLGDSARALLWTPARTPSGATLPYGIGWYVQSYQGRRLLWHSGWWEQAYSALYLKVPDRRLTVILLANSEGLWWQNPLDAAEVHRSPFAALFLRQLAGFEGRPGAP
ncbi:MAG: serine hydrolase domain-containing protein [Gemmatimonadaceae bacterium]